MFIVVSIERGGGSGRAMVLEIGQVGNGRIVCAVDDTAHDAQQNDHKYDHEREYVAVFVLFIGRGRAYFLLL